MGILAHINLDWENYRLSCVFKQKRASTSRIIFNHSWVFRTYHRYDGTANQGPNLALYQPSKQGDLDCHGDAITPRAAPGSKGILLLVR